MRWNLVYLAGAAQWAYYIVMFLQAVSLMSVSLFGIASLNKTALETVPETILTSQVRA